MRVFNFAAKALMDQLQERKEMAFLRWQRSGYHDIAAHDEYLALYDRAQRLLLSQPLNA